jgi:hypothetical protein
MSVGKSIRAKPRLAKVPQVDVSHSKLGGKEELRKE